MTYGGAQWPAQYTTGEVHGQVLDTTGEPIVGSLTFTPQAPVVGVVDQAVLVFAKPITVDLDENGSFSVTLPATDDPGVRPEKFTYQVVENWTGGRTYSIKVPTGTSSNIFDVGPIQPSIGLMQYFGPTGEAGPTGPAGPAGPTGPAGPPGSGLSVSVVDGGSAAAPPAGAPVFDGGAA